MLISGGILRRLAKIAAALAFLLLISLPLTFLSRPGERCARRIDLRNESGKGRYDRSRGDSAPPPTSGQPQTVMLTVEQAALAGMQRYTDVRSPILAIFALPHDRGITDPDARAAADARDLAFQGAQRRLLRKGYRPLE
jgi:hypothetical protein